MASIKWTVSIIYQYYEDEKEYFEFLKNDIESQANFNQVNYFLLKHDEKNKTAIAYTIDNSGKLDNVLTTYSTKEFYSNIKQAEEIWSKFLSYAGSISDAKHILIIEGHAAGLAFVTSRGMPEGFKKLRPLSELYQKLQIIFSHTDLDDDAYTKVYAQFQKTLNEKFNLSIPEEDKTLHIEKFGIIPVGILLSSIKNSYKNLKLQLVYFGNCYMQTLENGYLFKDKVEYMAGSEGMYFSTGTDFKSLFSALQGSVKIHELSKIICSGIETKLEENRVKSLFTNNEHNLELIKEFFSFSINNLSKYEELKNLLSQLGDLLLKNRAKLFKKIHLIRNDKFVCDDVAGNPIGIIDFINFCKLLRIKALPDHIEIVNIIDAIEKIVADSNEKFILSGRFPKACYEKKTPNEEYAIFPFGVSIFFSPNKPTVLNDQYINFFMNNYYKVDTFLSPFLTKNSWREFVDVFYNYDFRKNFLVRFFEKFSDLFRRH